MFNLAASLISTIKFNEQKEEITKLRPLII